MFHLAWNLAQNGKANWSRVSGERRRSFAHEEQCAALSFASAEQKGTARQQLITRSQELLALAARKQQTNRHAAALAQQMLGKTDGAGLCASHALLCSTSKTIMHKTMPQALASKQPVRDLCSTLLFSFASVSSCGSPVRVARSMSLTLGSCAGQHDTATPRDASMLQWLHVTSFAGTAECREVTAKLRFLVRNVS